MAAESLGGLQQRLRYARAEQGRVPGRGNTDDGQGRQVMESGQYGIQLKVGGHAQLLLPLGFYRRVSRQRAVG